MTDMRKGMVLGTTGLDFRRPDYINREVVQMLAHIVVAELKPSYAYCTGVTGWNGAWVNALLRAKIPYSMLLPYRGMSATWFHTDKVRLDTYTYNAKEVVYIADKYTDTVYVDRDNYLLTHVEGVVTLGRPLIENKVVMGATGLGIPVLYLWSRYINLLDSQRDT